MKISAVNLILKSMDHAIAAVCITALLITQTQAAELAPAHLRLMLQVSWDELLGTTSGLNNTSASDIWVADIKLGQLTLTESPGCNTSPCPASINARELNGDPVSIGIASTSEIPANHPAVRHDELRSFDEFRFSSNPSGNGTESLQLLDYTSGIHYPAQASGPVTWRRDRSISSPLLPAGSIARSTPGLVAALSNGATTFDVSESFLNRIAQASYVKNGRARVLQATLISGQTSPGRATCRYQIMSDWGSGFSASVSIRNESTTPINGWQLWLGFQYPVVISDHWGMNLQGTSPFFSTTPLSWNRTIYPGSEVQFGLIGTKPAGQSASAMIMGNICR